MLPLFSKSGKRAVDAEGKILDKEDLLTSLKDDCTAKLLIAQQLAGDSPLVQKVVQEVNILLASDVSVKDVLMGFPKADLDKIHSSTATGNLDYQIGILTKAIYQGSFEEVRQIEAAFGKLKVGMVKSVEYTFAQAYYNEGAHKMKEYAKDVFNAK